MGAGASLTSNELQTLGNISKLSKGQIKTLFGRFCLLNKGRESNTLAVESLSEMPEFIMSPMTAKLLPFFDPSQTGQVEFRDFVTTLAVFSPASSLKEKTKCKKHN
eukprot:Sdes_comp20535_c0_seq1m15209